MSKILCIGKEKTPAEINEILMNLFCVTEIENSDNLPTEFDEDCFVCIDGKNRDTADILISLGYKTVTIAYADNAIKRSVGNGDLEKHGYKFEDGM